MAAGSLSPNGVWQYGEDDARDTFSALLNIGQSSVSTAIGSDRARIAALEADGALGGNTSGIATVAANWTLVQAIGRKKNGTAWVTIRVTRAVSALTPSATGDLANSDIATLSTGWAAASGMQYPAASAVTGRVVSGTLIGTAITLGATTPGGVIAIGDEIGLNICYPLA